MDRGSSVHNTYRRFKIVKAGGATTPDVFLLEIDLPKQYYEPDRSNCPDCHKEFGWLRHRYHCVADGSLSCDDCMPKNKEHGNVRICRTCVAALNQKNQDSKDDCARRMRLAEDAKQQLEQIDDVVHNSMIEIVSEEEESFDLLCRFRQDDRRMAALKEKVRLEALERQMQDLDDDGDSSGAMSAAFMAAEASLGAYGGGGGKGGGGADGGPRRRVEPVYGVRSGVLTVRVQQLRHLPPIKMDGMLNPFVNVEAGVQSARTGRAQMEPAAALRLKQYREQLAQLTAQNPNTNFAGGGLNATFSFGNVTPSAGAGAAAVISPSPLPARRRGGTEAADDGASPTQTAQRLLNSLTLDFTIDDSYSFYVKDDRAGLQISVLDDTTQPNVPIFLGLAYVNLRKLNVLLIDATPHDVARAESAMNKCAANSRKPSQYKFDPASFENHVESARQTRVLNLETGQRNGDAQVVVTYTFHPQKQDFSSSHKHNHNNHIHHHALVICGDCDAADTPSTCHCSESRKLKAAESFLKRQLRQVAGELRAKELEMRKWRNEALEKGNSNEPYQPYGNLQIPKLHKDNRRKVETCCC